MGYRVRCRICGNYLNSDKAVKTKDGDRNVYFCKENEMQYWIKKREMEKVEVEDWNNLYEFVKCQVLNYDEHQKLPKYLVQKLQDIRNGIQSNKEREENKFKQGYPYQVIMATFRTKLNDIQYWKRTKSFKNEQQMINYMLAIIENNINDEYTKWKKLEQIKKELATKATETANASVELEVGLNAETSQPTVEKRTNLGAFLNKFDD